MFIVTYSAKSASNHPSVLSQCQSSALHRDVVGSVSYSNHLSAAFITSISANMYSMLKFRYELHAASNGLTARSVMQRHKIIGYGRQLRWRSCARSARRPFGRIW